MKFQFHDKEIDCEKIDYIRYKSQGYMLDQKSFFVVSIDGKEEVIEGSTTQNELDIWGEYMILKRIAQKVGLFPAKNSEGGAIINVLKAENLLLKKTKIFDRYYFEARFPGSLYDEGKVFKTTAMGKNKLAQMEKIIDEFNIIKAEKERLKQIELEKEKQARSQYYDELIRKAEMDNRLKKTMEEYNDFVEEEYEK